MLSFSCLTNIIHCFFLKLQNKKKQKIGTFKQIRFKLVSNKKCIDKSLTNNELLTK